MYNKFQSCPVDILKLIFEFLVARHPRGISFQYATAVSHVCRQYRLAALDAPKLWRHIECDMKRDKKGIKSFWERTAIRVKRLTVTISILNIGTLQDFRLKYCKISNFQRIDRLILQITDIHGITEVNDPSFIIPPRSISSLYLKTGPEPLMEIWECSQLFARFGLVKNVRMEGFVGATFAARKAFPVVKSLILRANSSFDFQALSIMLPSLTTLELDNVSIAPIGNGNPPVMLHKLKILKYTSTDGFVYRQWLTQISCPSLAQLIIEEKDRLHPDMLTYSLELEHFIHHHRSIITLCLPNMVSVDRIARVAPQVEHLQIRDLSESWYSKQVNNPAKPIFPNLKVLSFSWPDSGVVDDNLFLGLVRHRCLPLDHPDNQLITKNPLDCICIYNHPDKELPIHKWKELPFFMEAKKTVLESDGDDEVSIMLSWTI